MTKFTKIILILVLIFNFSISNANEVEIKSQSFSEKISENKQKKEITLEDSFIFFSYFFENEIPESYKYINLNFYGFEKGSEFEKALKVLVYKNKIPNLKINFSGFLEKPINSNSFFRISDKILGTGYSENTLNLIGNKKTDFYDLELIEESYKIIKNKDFYEKQLLQTSGVKNVLEEVYGIILEEHFDKDNFDKDQLFYEAIKGMLKVTGDKHTTFFPPVESKDFFNGLSGDFEGIGTYVDMPEPGVFKISTPLPNGPAEKAGIRGGDIIIEVDSKKITKENSMQEIISWIKGPAGTEVNLKIERNGEIFEIKVTREKVHLKSVEFTENGNNFIIKIVGFNTGVSDELLTALKEIKEKKSIRKIVFDLRDNGGGFLDEATRILSFFIEKGQPIVNVQYLNNSGKYLSKGYNIIDLNNYEISFLQNAETASASEIMIATIKDYFPKTKIVGEKSYGKGSVQSIKEFYDGSSLKYTTAKWFSGKGTGIDGIGILPDFEIKFDENLYKNSKIDNQLQKALSI